MGEAMANTSSLTTLCETIAQSMLIHPTPAMGRGGDGWSGPFLASCQFFDWPSQPGLGLGASMDSWATRGTAN